MIPQFRTRTDPNGKRATAKPPHLGWKVVGSGEGVAGARRPGGAELTVGTGSTGRGVGQSPARFAPGTDDAFQSAYLGQVGPVAVAHQQLGNPNPSLFNPITVLVDLPPGQLPVPRPNDKDLELPPCATTRWHTFRWVKGIGLPLDPASPKFENSHRVQLMLPHCLLSHHDDVRRHQMGRWAAPG